MVDVLVNNRQLIADACARFGVSRLDVFGSALSDEFRPGKSDLDLLVELGPMDPYDRIAADIERTKQVVYAA